MSPTMSVEADDCSPNTKSLHFLLVPLMAQGHMIPMVDLARLLAVRGVLVSFVTTPVNLARIQPIADQVSASSLPIHFIELPFPATDVGLPEGCENADLIPSAAFFLTFMNAQSLLRDPLESHLRIPNASKWPKPSCIISDNLQHWTADVALSLNIPRIIFHGPSCIYMSCQRFIDQNRAELQSAIEAASGEPVIIRGLPHPIQVSKHEVMAAWRSDPGWSKFVETVQLVEESAAGVVVNSFTELEPWYFERYREMMGKGKPIWPVGPLSLYNKEIDAKETRGRASSVDTNVLLRWLDEQENGSVVLVSFGSIARDTMDQLVELGQGLEATGRPFIWVVKWAEEMQGMNEWLTELEKRVEGRGMVIRGWAPQTVILEHAAVGGFVTHCGWNSTLEAVAAGVVMVTWPHFADQFLNERLVVDVLKVGVAVGVKEPTVLGLENKEEEVVQVGRGEVERAVEMLMGGGEEGEERRLRAKELREKAKMAMEKGGSSWEGLEDVIKYVAESAEKTGKGGHPF
ncbi:UDP-glycosyltransferase 73E1-like [Phalaenopsis equestris]|uniref:UDP-glycosyltransferase 73E1-like n=1 Tax=Phalaenopsis equestris TaxID=78828 RepID=UPI0009E2700F|nr:UDP-glycosyltransferase 73E1-like [Phalaenopsis equestris]